jgi:hypothetical protein
VTRTPNSPMYDTTVLAAAKSVSDRAIASLLEGRRPKRAVVTRAPAGAGKTGFLINASDSIRKRKLRVAIGTPTNEQAFELVRRLASAPSRTITYVPATSIEVPVPLRALRNVRTVTAREANSGDLIVATLNKLGDAFSRHDIGPVDVLLIDESYQAKSAVYYAAGGLADLHLLVGDYGQLMPFSTVPDPDFWRGLPENPLQTAVGILLRNHPTTPVFSLPLSRRLDARAVAVTQSFYPDLPFRAAVLPDVRELRLVPSVSTRGQGRIVDAALDRAAQSGWAHVELPAAPVLTTDPDVVSVISALVDRLAQRGARVRCELSTEWRDLDPARIAVAVSHNDQKDILRARLDAQGNQNVVVETANKLQGLEFDFVIAWHPLAGLPNADEFHLDPGRLCVMMTRHRHACVVVGRASDRMLLDAIPPPTPAYLGDDPEPLYQGWAVHEAVFGAMEQHRV